MACCCEHNSKARLPGLCKPCSEVKPYMVFRDDARADTSGGLGIRLNLNVANDPIGAPLQKKWKMMTKLPYDYVSREVDKLYEKKIPEHDLDAINKHCDFIREFINACGWTEEEYIRAMFDFEPLDKRIN